MSDTMAHFIANLIPYFAFLWALNLVLFYKTLYSEFFNVDTEETNKRLIVPFAAIGFASLFIILPVRTMINACFKNDGEEFSKYKYEDYYLKFPTDYDRENPVTKNDAFIRLIEFKIQNEKSEHEK